MKKLFIVGSYPSTKKQKEQLVKCINSLKPLGWDILLVTHYPVPIEMQSMVDYFKDIYLDCVSRGYSFDVILFASFKEGWHPCN